MKFAQTNRTIRDGMRRWEDIVSLIYLIKGFTIFKSLVDKA